MIIMRERPLSDNMRESQIYVNGGAMRSFSRGEQEEQEEEDLKTRVNKIKGKATGSPKKRKTQQIVAGQQQMQQPESEGKKQRAAPFSEDVGYQERKKNRFEEEIHHNFNERLHAENSPSPYENERFEPADLYEDETGIQHPHLESQEGDDDGVDNDVSSEGSCRTSQF